MRMDNTQGPQGTVEHVQLDDTFGVNIHTRPMGSHSVRPGAVNVHEHSVIREPAWDITKWVQRPQVVSSVPWTTSNATTTVLANLLLPQDLLVTKFLKSPFDSFKYWRGTIEFHLQTSGTPFHQGTIIAAYLPNMTSSGLVGRYADNFAALTTMQHVILQANTSTSACLTIPFINPFMYIDKDETYTFKRSTGRLIVVVFNPLKAASGASTSINVTTVVQFKDSQFKIPRYQAEGLIEKTFGISGGMILQRMLPRNIIADTVDLALGLVGLDRPTSIQRSMPMKALGTGYMNSSIDIDYIDKFSLFPSKLQEIDASTFGVSDNETMLQSLLPRYSYIGTFEQTTTDAPGKLLASVPLCPFPVPIVPTNNTSGPFNSYRNYIPLIQYLSLPYHFWKGGLSFKIQVVGTSFHNTKIFAAIQYGRYGTPDASVSIAQATNQYGYAFEVNQGSTEFEFVVPYVSMFHQLTTSGSVDYIYNDRTCMGTLCIYVLNELAVSNNVPADISYNVYIAGASDFALNTLSSNNQAVYPLTTAGEAFVAESLFEDPPTVAMQTDKNVISPNTNTSQRDDLGDQSVLSVLQQHKKYTLVYSGVLVGSKSASLFRAFRVNNLFSTFAVEAAPFLRPTWSTSLLATSAMYRGFRGPIRFKIVMRSSYPSQSFKVFYLPPRSNFNNSIVQNFISSLADDSTSIVNRNRPWNHVHMVNSIDKTAEIEVPYTVDGNFVIPGYNGGELGVLVIQFDPVYMPVESVSSTADISFDIYAAIGDEAKFGVFVGAPPVQIDVNSTTGAPVDTAVGWTNTPSPLYSLTQLR